MSLYLWQKKERSYKNYTKYLQKILSIMNSDLKPLSFNFHNTSIHGLFSLQNVEPSFFENDEVFELYTPFQKKLLFLKQSVTLGRYMIHQISIVVCPYCYIDQIKQNSISKVLT